MNNSVVEDTLYLIDFKIGHSNNDFSYLLMCNKLPKYLRTKTIIYYLSPQHMLIGPSRAILLSGLSITFQMVAESLNGLNTEDGFFLLGLEPRMEWLYGTSFFMWLAGFSHSKVVHLMVVGHFTQWLLFYAVNIPEDSGGSCKKTSPRMSLPLHLICQANHQKSLGTR